MSKGLFLRYLSCAICMGWSLISAAETSLGQNRSPVFDPAASCFVGQPSTVGSGFHGGGVQGGTFTTCYVSEGESLEVFVHASDPDGDPVNVSVLNAPHTAWFEDLGDGEASLVWMPEYVGPLSSARSPFELFFVASDGESTTRLRVVINVINVNREPQLVLPESAQVAAGNELVFQVRAYDPDFEPVSIQALNLPPQAAFDSESGMFNWSPQQADTGFWPVAFRATDYSGGKCLRQAHLKVTEPSTHSLNLGVKESLLGGVVSMPVNLSNSDPIAGMELLIQFDPTIFHFLGASRQGSRTEKWEYFTCREKTWGLYQLIKMVGIADFPNQTEASPLQPDSGAIVYLRFRVTSDPHLSGLLAPLEFFSFDFTDNTLSTPQGQFIDQGRVNLNNGGVLLGSSSALLGDVNTNGLAFEVGDAVKLASYLTGLTILTEQQLINSDVNQDGRFASLSDLVFLINRILQEESVPEGGVDEPDQVARIRILQQPHRGLVRLDSDVPVRGALLIFKGETGRVANVKLSPEAGGLDLYTSQRGDEFRVLIVSREAEPLPSEGSYVFSFEGGGFDTVGVSLADQEGKLLAVKQEFESASRPAKHSLDQNYPNPFNPSTSIRYSVSGDGPMEVSLRIYNVAGRLVRTLVDGQIAPAEYEVIWNGRNEGDQEVASGLYFYRLQVSDYVETKKMVLLR
jgi:hypothetical protein